MKAQPWLCLELRPISEPFIASGNCGLSCGPGILCPVVSVNVSC